MRHVVVTLLIHPSYTVLCLAAEWVCTQIEGLKFELAITKANLVRLPRPFNSGSRPECSAFLARVDLHELDAGVNVVCH
jgi:hypothetical protein